MLIAAELKEDYQRDQIEELISLMDELIKNKDFYKDAPEENLVKLKEKKYGNCLKLLCKQYANWVFGFERVNNKAVISSLLFIKKNYPNFSWNIFDCKIKLGIGIVMGVGSGTKTIRKPLN